MKFYFKISFLRTDDDFERLGSLIDKHNIISTSELTNQDKCKLLECFNKTIAESSYYQEGNRHSVRKNAIRAVDLYFEMQTNSSISNEEIKRWRKRNIEWLIESNIGFSESCLLFEGVVELEGAVSNRFIYIPFDENGVLSCRKYFKSRIPFLFGTYRKMVKYVYNSNMTSQSSIIKDDLMGNNDGLNKALFSEQTNEINELMNVVKNLKSRLYDTENKLREERTLADLYRRILKTSGNPDMDDRQMNQLIMKMIIMQHAYKMYKELNMEQEYTAFDNAQKYAAIYFKKHPDEKSKYFWIN